MFIEWSPIFETKIELVDQQHKTLFAMLNRLTEDLERGLQSEEELEDALNELLAYADQHFIDEENVMNKHHLVDEHISLQRMEHKSFIYDVNRMRINPPADETLEERLEKLIKFVTSWLVYHTLRTDQIMALQVSLIQHGRSPEEAYDLARNKKPNPIITQMVLQAVLHLWAEQTERCQILELEIAQLKAGLG